MIEPNYIVLLKSLAGIIFSDGEKSSTHPIQWLEKNFAYSEFGALPSLSGNVRRTSVIKPIQFPFHEYEPLLERISAAGNADCALVEAIAAASVLACPLIMLSGGDTAIMRHAAIYIFRADFSQNDKALKYALLDCQRAMNDLFIHSLEQAHDAIGGQRDVHKVMISRRAMAKEDAGKRFWRFGDGSQGKPFIMYLDLLPFAAESGIGDVPEIPIFAIVPAICIA